VLETVNVTSSSLSMFATVTPPSTMIEAIVCVKASALFVLRIDSEAVDPSLEPVSVKAPTF